jgi:Domain of unknown function (DUF397)
VLNRSVSDDDEGSGRTWRKSSRSYGSGECIEVATPSGKRIAVRDSKNAQGTVLSFSSAQWNTFVAGIRSGKLGRLKREAQKPKASTVPARSSVSRPGVALGTASLRAAGPVVVGIARLASAYGRSVLLSCVSYA